MSKYTERIQEILTNINSKRIIDKRKCVVEFLELYEDKEAINEICKNTEQNVQSIVNWSYIMHTVHKVLLSETDRHAKKSTYTSVIVTEKQNTCALVRKTVQHANSYKVPLLKCNDILPLILQILETKIYKYYHETYLNVLATYILPLRIYQVHMLPDYWQELLKICVNLYKDVSSLTNKRTTIDALQMIVHYGCIHSNLYFNIKEIFSFLEAVFLDVQTNQEILTESACKLTNTVCQQVAIEHRILLCQFIENILPSIINLKSSIEKYKLILLFVKIHHPKGACKVCDGAYANNWDKWYALLKCIYLMILKDLKADILPKSFIQLASEVFKQVLEDPNVIIEKKLFDECDYAQPAKRRRIATKVDGLLDMIRDNNAEEAWPIVQILTALLKEYPECLKLEDLTAFLKILVDLFTQFCNEETITNNLYELAAVILANEKIFSGADIENLNIHWDKIWDILLRSLSVNQNEESTHRLTQLFIINNKITNLNALLKLYLTSVIKWSIMSLRTLIILCEHLPLPSGIPAINMNMSSPAMNSNSVRSCLLKWALNIPWHKMATQIVIDELCSLLIIITSKSRHENLTKSAKDTINNSCNCLQSEEDTDLFCKRIENCYLLLTCKGKLFTKTEEDDTQQTTKVNERILYMQDIVNSLITSLSDVFNESSGTDDLHIIIIKIAVVAKVISLMRQLDMISGNIEEVPLVHIMKKYLDITCTSLAKINPSKSKYIYLYSIMKALNILYETLYDTYVATVIVSSTTLEMLKYIFALMNIEDNEIADYEATNAYFDDYGTSHGRCKDREIFQKRQCNFCNKGTIRIQATKALTMFCCMNVGEEKCEIQTKLMTNLLKIDMYDLSRTVDFKMAITVLEFLPKYGQKRLWKHHEEVPLKDLVQLYRECREDETAVRYILHILPYFLKYARDYDCNLDDLMSIISQLNKLRSKKKHGYLIHIKFTECLSRIVHINPPLLHYTLFNNCDQLMPIVESLLSSLTSSSFAVCLEVINCVRRIYSLRNIDFKWKETLFIQIEESLNKLIVTTQGRDGAIEVNEKETRITSIMLILAAIISTNGTFQARALLSMLRFVIDQKIDSQKIPKILSTIEDQISYSSLIKDNLSYLMTYWFDSKYSSQPFPWNLTQCKSEQQFYETYINTLVFIKLQNLELRNAILLCDRVSLSIEQVIENIFPQILTWLLYCINDNNDSNRKKSASIMFHKLVSNQDEFVRLKKFSNLFNEKFEEILIYLTERLHDEDYLEKILGIRISFASSDPPHLKKKVLDSCLKYMEENFFAQKISIQYVLVRNCSNILQKMLFNLISNIYKTTFLEHKIKAFHQYVFFCTLIVEELNQNYFDTMAMYVIKDIGYSLLHIIKEDNDLLSELACKYFYKFIKRILPIRNEEIEEILSFIVITLIPIAQTGKMPIALDVLNLLLIDQKDVLCNAIEKLNSFPNIPIFQEIRNIHNALKCKTEKTYTLEDEIQHFLNSLVDKNVNYSTEDISHLQLQLSTRKKELWKLYDKLETIRGFAEDYASSMLHQLIYKLIKLTASSDINIAIESVKCLSELGPTDLTSMILYLEKSHVKETSDLIEILSYKTVINMIKFLFQSNIELRRVSANALYVIFSSSWGQKLLNTDYIKRLKDILGESEMMLPLNYIQPFIIGKTSKTKTIGLSDTKVKNIINPNNVIWTVKSNDSYCKWIEEITCNILECFTGFYFECLIPVCTLSADFCELILPRIIFLIINIDKKFAAAICFCINQFFDYHFNFIAESTVPSHIVRKNTTNCDHQIVRCMLNIVNYIRIQVADNIHLKLNYMYIAKAAQYCSAFFTAILYAEMSCENILSDHTYITSASKIEYLYELAPEEGKMIQSILRDTYLKIGDFDAIDGTGSSHLQDHSTRMQHYVSKHNKVMLAEDIELSFGNMSVVKKMANGLHQSGLQFLLGHFISVMPKSDGKIDDGIQYDYAWQLSNWNFCEASQTLYTQNDSISKSEITECDYHFYHYQALKYFHEHNEVGIQNALENARISIIKALRNISLESSETIYEKLTQLQLIREIEELSSAKPDEYEKVLQKWQQQDVTNFNEFQYIEPILTQRIVMYQINDVLMNNAKVKTELFNTYLEMSKIAADKENLHIATRSLAVLAKQKDLPPNIQDQLLYQEALLARLAKDLEVGRFLLRNLIHKETLDPNLRAQILRVYGDWMVETKSENPQAVIEKYYLKSIDTSVSINEASANSIKNLHRTQVALARFADAQFEQISSYIKSPQFESLKECVTYSSKGISINSVSKDVRKALILNQRQNSNDVAELEHIQKERDNYLILALQYYLVVLQQSEDYNLLIFRIIALWLDNIHQKEVNDLLDVHLNKIPSYKFIPLAPQLAAHMNDNFDEFSKKIYNIMKRCAIEHPHHTLPVLLALKNLYGDYEYETNKKSITPESRVLGAKKLLHELTRSNVSSIVQEMDKLSHSLVMLANLATPNSKPGCTINIPRNQEILKMKNLKNVLVPTLTIDVKSSRDYNGVTGIYKYTETYETVGGLNTPKKLICIGADGVARYQLVKGKDDLRQDAVMQQVFNVMNTLLKNCKETKRRKLKIRTYKVVPLTQRSGILEWCDNTMPIITVLTGSSNNPGLYKKYYPKDYTPNYCKEKIASVDKSSTDVKLKVFLDCCKHLHPAMHHFFTEKYPSPETWFERRLAYTRSIATTSMAGYILGLGDRHLNNILIDQTTAEVIHIDFGIAFEQGKVLPVPETIPFRLTRNIEAAMGVSGIEGTMRHCCEKTLAVLRDQKQVIITLLQVLLYDPLFTWTITPAKARDIQSGSSSRTVEINQCSTVTNKSAERALLRIEQKLQGTEEGLASSVSGQVERLIQQARDSTNLCRLYCGWQPYL